MTNKEEDSHLDAQDDDSTMKMCNFPPHILTRILEDLVGDNYIKNNL